MRHIALVSDTLDWHARRMEAAYAAQAVRASRVDLAACNFASSSPSGLEIPGFAALPDAVHVRTLAAGSFEAVTRRLGVLHALARLGVRVVNDARAIEACVDKSMTSFLVARAGLPTPETWTLESREQARALARREIERGPLVLKPLFGAQGKGLKLIRAADDLPDPEAVAGVYYLQRFVTVEGEDFRDYRFFVSGGRVVAAMQRRAATWITNVKQGGEPFAVAREAGLEALALTASRAVGAEIAGVDLIVGRDGPQILEVNSMPAWSGLQKVTSTDIAGAIAQDVLRGLKR